MKIQYLATLAVASVIGFSAATFSHRPSVVQAAPCAAAPCASVNPCAGSPCASKNPCAGNPCAAKDPCASKTPCASATKVSSAPEIYTDPQANDNLAVRGYDVVAYFTQGKPVQGTANYEYDWNGATWRFSSAEHLKQFKANPEAYAPQYGGYCAKAMSEGNVVSTIPEAWKVVDDKLYLNFSLDVQNQWLEDVPGNIVKGDNNWPKALTNPEGVYYDTVGWVKY